ncbi:hypothetical protein [Pedobacter sp.]|uniref:hypothetical protein n=1 Tax=Pedobacter sp. TaxID=1411316 RepID=UPI003D7F7705
MKHTTLDTQKLNQVQDLMSVFKDRYSGKAKAVKTADLLFHLKASGKGIISPQTLRELLGYIRHNDLLSPGFIVSNVNIGYWLSFEKEELSGYLDQELNRMSNQFQNLQLLHQRTKYGQKTALKTQQSLF